MEDTTQETPRTVVSADHVADATSTVDAVSPSLQANGSEIHTVEVNNKTEDTLDGRTKSEQTGAQEGPVIAKETLQDTPTPGNVSPVSTVHDLVSETASTLQSSVDVSSDGASEIPIPPAKDSPADTTISRPVIILSDSTKTTTLPPPPPDHDIEQRRPPTPSQSSRSSSSTHKRSLTMSKGNNVSVVLIISALETIAASKEAKRSAPLRDATQRALELIRSNKAIDHPREILEALRLACETKNEKLMIASLDCISKLISYSFFAEDDVYVANEMPSPPVSPHPGGRTSQTNIPQPSLVDLVVHTITACHIDGTPETVSLQIVKALLALVLSPSVFVHHSSLLKTVRTVYNVFLLSRDPVNQMVAQGGLSQMVHHIFTRCKALSAEGSGDTLVSPNNIQSFTVSSRNSLALTDVVQSSSDSIKPEIVTSGFGESTASLSSLHLHHNAGQDFNPQAIDTPSRNQTDSPIDLVFGTHKLTQRDLFIKDAYLVFRALCKLTMKPLNTESERDPRTHPMRSKLLALHLVLTVLNSHMPLFVDPTAIVYSNSQNEPMTFIQATNQHLCVCLSRNAVSAVPQVFDISVEIFWRVLSGMRTKLKKEIELLLHEIFIPILEMRTSTLKQKAVILGMLWRLCQDPQALVEIYLNYDCDSEASDNIYEHLMNLISKFASMPLSAIHQKGTEPPSPALSPTPKNQKNSAQNVFSLGTYILPVPGSLDTSTMGLSEGQLRRQGIECLVSVIRSLVTWGTTVGKSADDAQIVRSQNGEENQRKASMDGQVERLAVASSDTLRNSTPELVDDPTRFESAKQKKTTLLEGIKKFNFKPKKGIHFLLEHAFISSRTPRAIAEFLLTTDGLNKAMIGEYLGEGEEENIAIMHAFVDQLEFRDSPFVDALRLFLQPFRLPGEAQKIDRFMLKFADRYIADNPKTPFKNADSAYVLAYSVILLNTDAHNPQVKKRMTKTDFLKNNRGINDGSDLPEELLSEIYDDIVNNEIRMKDEVEATAPSLSPGPGLANALASVGRDLQREAYVMQSNGMATKTEALFRTLMRSQRKGAKSGDQFFSASHFVHVRPMFEVAWIPFLAGLSGPLQDTGDQEVVEMCLEGFKNAIKIVCFFDLELQRNAFVTTLAKFTFLNNLGEMKTKNMDAIKTLLDVAVTEGNNLKGSWHEVLTCVSQLEHMQLISGGVDLPESGKKGRTKKLPNEELANESRSTHITVAADMVFSLSHYLSGTAIVDFVQALSDVSWEEIQSSGLSQHPRMFSLQKLVEISYYNMNRIRIEWSNMWEILGEHFNQVCCHNNPHVCFFALDALRQLAMRFLEKEELPNFKFQKDFLKPFEHTMIRNQNPEIRDLVLQCLKQMIQARVQNMRSGWLTMFGVFSAASRVLTERIANTAFEIVTRLNKEHFAAIVRHGAFADLTVCITEFCKTSKYQKISLLAIAMLRGIIPVMLECPECTVSTDSNSVNSVMDDGLIRYWLPVLFAFYDIIMNGEDLEVRRLALDSLFSTLKLYGRNFPIEFWDTICKEHLYPIFACLKSSQDLTRFNTQEDMSVWLQTTMIQALRDLIDLFTFHFDILERFLDGLLNLLCICICQEHDTLARLGTSCLQQFLENNVKKLSPERWDQVTTSFVKLFRTTTPHQLFDDGLRLTLNTSAAEPADSSPDTTNGMTILPAPLSPSNEQIKMDIPHAQSARKKIFKQIIIKCVLQLLLIEMTNELLRNDDIYSTIPPDQLLRLMGVLDHSYQFARSFNDDKELRTALWKAGFMKHLPNLLKQESSSAATLVHILLRMYYDARPDHFAARPQIADRLLPLGLGVLQDYNRLKSDTQSKNIAAWTPVVAEILDGLSRLDDKSFERYLSAIYPLTTELLSREIAPEIRLALRSYLIRVGYNQGIMDGSPPPA